MIRVISEDPEQQRLRESSARDVLNHFVPPLEENRVGILLDDHDEQELKAGPANKGQHLGVPPECESKTNEAVSYILRRMSDPPRLCSAFDSLIYLHESTCRDEIGPVITLAHELQHAVQCKHSRQMYLAGHAMKTLLNPIPKGLEATPIPDHHFPLEIEARIVSKRIAQQMFDAGSCTRFLNSSISKAVDLDEIEDLTFISEIGASNPYDLRTATSEFFREQPQKI